MFDKQPIRQAGAAFRAPGRLKRPRRRLLGPSAPVCQLRRVPDLGQALLGPDLQVLAQLAIPHFRHQHLQ